MSPDEPDLGSVNVTPFRQAVFCFAELQRVAGLAQRAASQNQGPMRGHCCARPRVTPKLLRFHAAPARLALWNLQMLLIHDINPICIILHCYNK